MKACVALLLLASACTSNRPPALTAPTDGAEYYQPGSAAHRVIPRLYPDPQGGLGHSQDPSIRVTDIRLTASYTVLYLTFGKDPNERYQAFSTSSVSFNPKAVLASADGKRTYALLKTEGIPMTPDSREVKSDETVPFVLYFERLDKGVELFDLFECKSDNQNSCFNVAGMMVENPLESSTQLPR